MTADHFSYKRATNVSLMGLTIQALLFLVMLVYGLMAGDVAAVTGALAIGLGSVVWVSLAIVFHQHKLERLEAMELESYMRSSAAQASVFEEARVDEQPNARRLVTLHKYFLPAISLALAVLYAGVGLWRFALTRGDLSIDSGWAAPIQGGWAISIGLGIVIVGFVFARFIAGMAKQEAWMLLHAGSGAAVGSALMGAMLALAHFINFATQSEALLRYLAPIFAIVMIVIGVEMALNFLLNLYRPRQLGEYQRPAFDSRVLAFIAAPDRLAESIGEAINYQFGFDVSSTWFYRLFSRQLVPLMLLSVVVMLFLSMFTIVKPHEQGLLIVNGKLKRSVTGLVVSWPWPIARVERFPALAVNELNVGSGKPSVSGAVLWTNEHTTDERFFLVQPAATIDRRGSSDPSGDLNLIAAEIPITYVIQNLAKYKQLAQDGLGSDEDSMRQDLLEALASKQVIEYMATKQVDDLLGGDRRVMAGELQRLIQSAFDRVEAGVNVIFVGLIGVQPSKEVAQAFEEVVEADQLRLTLVERANGEAIRTLAKVVGEVDRARTIVAELNELDRLNEIGAPQEDFIRQEQVVIGLIMEAGGEAAVLLSEARTDRWRTHLDRAGRAVAVGGLISSYRAAPSPFRVTRYLSALRDAARGARVYISPIENIKVQLNKEEQAPIVSGFDLGPESGNE